jgi:hypothetical protein
MIGPLLKWYGSKITSSKHYPAPLPNLPIIEPFVGGAGYSCRYHKHNVILWDTSPLLAELWQWIINEATPELIAAIPLDLPTGTDITSLGLPRGSQLLLKHWQRTNNVGPCMTTSPWGSLSGQFTKSCKERLIREIPLVKHWKFQEPDWTMRGTWMIDPPYKFNYQYGVKNFDYNKLVDNIRKIPQGSLVIACEAVGKGGEVPDYLPFQPSHSQVTSRRKASNNHHSRELVYVRYT